MNVLTCKRPADHALGLFCILVMSLLVVCVVWQVFSRYVLNDPSTFTDEAARYLMMWVGLLGGAYTVGLQRHLSIDLISGSLEGRARHLVQVLINITIFTFALLIVFKGGLDLVGKVLDRGQVSPVMRVPMGYVYLALPISGAFMMFYSGLFTLDHAIQMCHSGDPATQHQEENR